MRSAVVSAVFLVAIAGTAAAQPGVMPPTAAAPAPPPGEQLSESTALALSLGGTVASWGMVVASAEMGSGTHGRQAIGTIGGFGAYLAPGFGHWYARKIFTRGLGLRLLGTGVVFAGALVAFSECPLFSSNDCHESVIGPGLAIAGSALFVGGTIDDIAGAPGAVRNYNQRFHDVAIVPVIRGDSSGVMIAGRF